MAKKFTKEEMDSIIADYNNGVKPFELAIKYNRNSGTIINKLKDIGVYHNTTIRSSDIDISKVALLYQDRDWDKIFELYPELTKDKVYSLMSRNGIKSQSIFWKDSDIDYLVKNYGVVDTSEIVNHLKRSYSAIISKANKLGIASREYWSDEEIQILRDNYPYKTVDEMLDVLPKRNRKTITEKACELKIKNVQTYRDEDKQFVICHYKDMTDAEIAKALKKLPQSIMFLRHRLGLFKQVETSCFNKFKDVFRKSIGSWKEKSMQQCNYQCVVTGGSFDHIHHLYSFATICQEVLSSLNIDLSQPFDTYRDRMDDIVSEFIVVHNSYPLGVCLSKEVHNEFHRRYGNKNNTPQQWENFLKSYNG